MTMCALKDSPLPQKILPFLKYDRVKIFNHYNYEYKVRQ